MERKADADLHYLQALEALNYWRRSLPESSVSRDPLETKAQFLLALAHVSAIREQTAALERIAVALERQDVVEIEERIEPGDVDRLLAKGWVYCGHNPVNTGDSESFLMHVLGRPRNVPEGGGESG